MAISLTLEQEETVLAYARQTNMDPADVISLALKRLAPLPVFDDGHDASSFSPSLRERG